MPVNVQSVNPGARRPSRYVILPDPLGIRAWWVMDDGQLGRGPSGHKPRNMRNLMTRQGHTEVTLSDIDVASAASPEVRL